VFIALGNENRADDASAYHFIDKLKKQHPLLPLITSVRAGIPKTFCNKFSTAIQKR
jgi:hypothetical protein